MKYNQAQRLLTKNIDNMTLEQIQKHKVDLIDAWRHSEAAYGYKEAVKNGFYLIVADEYSSGYFPRDIWLTSNIKTRYFETERKEAELLEATI